eukprot:TRINITY_DN7174_c0_g1_i2.p1 TRINITY_DN7174_c0_g1~~TRINITY_DN7174_c0_g1_i2.p1  ORF type:complete len:504 (-),score=89.73 TRINITY_DN7174_c0_g1_i2:177-1688(-)
MPVALPAEENQPGGLIVNIRRQIQELKRQKIRWGATGSGGADVASDSSVKETGDYTSAATSRKATPTPEHLHVETPPPSAKLGVARRVIRPDDGVGSGLVQAAAASAASTCRTSARGRVKLLASSTGSVFRGGHNRIVRRPMTRSSGGANGAVRLKSASGLAVRRLGVPLRTITRSRTVQKDTDGLAAASHGISAGSGCESEHASGQPSSKRARVTRAVPARGAARVFLSSAGGVTMVKEQVASSGEDHGAGYGFVRKVIPGGASTLRRPGVVLTKVEPKEDRDAPKNNEDSERLSGSRAHLQSRGRCSGGDVVDARGRALFGKLMTHLASARTQLTGEAGKRPNASSAMRSWRASEPTTDKTEEQAPRRSTDATFGKEITREELFHRQKEAEARSQELEKKIYQKEMSLLQHRLEAHYSLMKNFIRTRSEPTIFYLPVKHTPKTERYLEESKAAIDQKILSLRTHLQTMPDNDMIEGSDFEEHAGAAVSEAAAKDKRKRAGS